MSKRVRIVFLLILFIAAFVSCRSIHDVAYISDAERDSAQRILTTYTNTIHPGDQLYIYVNSLNPQSVAPFNQEMHSVVAEANRMASIRGESSKQQNASIFDQRSVRQVPGYMVDEAGTIIFPLLGKLHVEGITQDSLSHLIRQRLITGDYVYDPVVTVNSMNFRVTVIGEVRRPQELHITGDRLTILEALAMCGDIADLGRRDNVLVLREVNGDVIPMEVDLTKKTLFDSECYYLQQNDLVYVEPNEKKKRRANYDPNLKADVMSYVHLGSSFVRLGYITWRRYILDRRGLFH